MKFVVLLVIVIISVKSSSDALPNGTVTGAVNLQNCYLGIRVEFEYYEKGEVENYSHRKTLQSSENFRSVFKSVNTRLAKAKNEARNQANSQQSAEGQESATSGSSGTSSSQSEEISLGYSVGGSGYGFSAEASFEMSNMASSMSSAESSYASSQASQESEGSASSQGTSSGVSSDSSNSESSKVDSRNINTISEEIAERTKFNSGFLQIYRSIVTVISINGKTAKTDELKYVDSVPIDDHKNREELKLRAEEDVKYKFGGSQKGRVWRNTYSECGCVTCQQCNICGLEDDEDEVKKINQKIENLNTQINTLQSGITDLKSEDRSIARQMENLNTQINTLESEDKSITRQMNGLSTRMGKVEKKSSVWFDAWRTSVFDVSGVYRTITYTNARRSSSYNSAMSTSTGKFTAPLAGTYQFIIQVQKYYDVTCSVRIKMDGAIVSYIYDEDESNRATITGTAIVELQPGNKVWAESFNKLFSDSDRPAIHFTGVLITPK